MRQLNKTQWKALYSTFRASKDYNLGDMSTFHYLMAYRVFKRNPANYCEPITDLKLRLVTNEFNIGVVFH